MKTSLLAGLLASLTLMTGCRKETGYSLGVKLGEKSYYVLRIPPRLRGEGTGAVYGLRHNPDQAAGSGPSGSWMAFWGEDPPQPEASAHKVLKDPFLLRVTASGWEAAQVNHQLLKAIRAGKDGDPELVYDAPHAGEKPPKDGPETVEAVKNWSPIGGVTLVTQ